MTEGLLSQACRVTAHEIRSDCVPSAFPGYNRFRLLPSTGFRCGTICANDARLSRGSTTSVPERLPGSTDGTSLCMARIDAYSVPWAPEISASTGPGRAPLITMMGRLVLASAPADTARKPLARCPVRAVALPKVTSAAGAALHSASAISKVDLEAKVFPLLLFAGPALLLHQFPKTATAHVGTRRELLLFDETLRRLADAAPIDAGDGHDCAGTMLHFSPLGPSSQSASFSMWSTRRSGAASASGSRWNP